MVIQRIQIATLPLLKHCVRRIQLQQKLGAAHKLSRQKMYISQCLQPFSNSASLFVIVHGWSSWSMEYLVYGELENLVDYSESKINRNSQFGSM